VKILQFSQIGSRTGGAAEISYLLKQGLEENGHFVDMISPEGTLSDGSTIQLPVYMTMKQRLALDESFKEGLLDKYGFTHLCLRRMIEKYDVLHIHNFTQTGLTLGNIVELSKSIKVVVTGHDMSLLTGRCAHSFSCERFKTGCFECPLPNIEPLTRKDSCKEVWEYKSDTLKEKHKNITFVAPSKWLESLMRQGITKNQNIRVVDNGVDTNNFKYEFKSIAREKLGLPQGKQILLYVAHGGKQSPWRCNETIDKTLEHFKSEGNVLLVSLGNSSKEESETEIKLPYITDKSLLSLYYAASSAFIFPSKADTSPLVVREAILSGTPVCSYNVGGIPELIEPGVTGYLAKPGDIDDFIIGVENVLGYSIGQDKLRELSEKWSYRRMTGNYLDLYSKMLT
jgi:glycosyltransferase involved in cell wall biosynthesis